MDHYLEPREEVTFHREDKETTCKKNKNVRKSSFVSLEIIMLMYNSNQVKIMSKSWCNNMGNTCQCTS